MALYKKYSGFILLEMILSLIFIAVLTLGVVQLSVIMLRLWVELQVDAQFQTQIIGLVSFMQTHCQRGSEKNWILEQGDHLVFKGRGEFWLQSNSHKCDGKRCKSLYYRAINRRAIKFLENISEFDWQYLGKYGKQYHLLRSGQVNDWKLVRAICFRMKLVENSRSVTIHWVVR